MFHFKGFSKFITILSIPMIFVSCSDSSPVDTVVDLGLGPSREALEALRSNAWCGNLVQRDYEAYIERYQFTNPSNPNQVTEWNKATVDMNEEWVIFKQSYSKQLVETSLEPIDPMTSTQIQEMLAYAQVNPEEMENPEEFVAVRLTQAEGKTLDLIPCVGISEKLTGAANSEYYNYELNLQTDKGPFHVQPLTVFPTLLTDKSSQDEVKYCRLNNEPEVMEIKNGVMRATIFPNVTVTDFIADPEIPVEEIVADAFFELSAAQDIGPSTHRIVAQNGESRIFSYAQDFLETNVIVQLEDPNDINPRRSNMYFPCTSFYEAPSGVEATKELIEALVATHESLK